MQVSRGTDGVLGQGLINSDGDFPTGSRKSETMLLVRIFWDSGILASHLPVEWIEYKSTSNSKLTVAAFFNLETGVVGK